MERQFLAKRISYLVLFVGLVLSGSNYYLGLGLFGQYGQPVWFSVMGLSLVSLLLMSNVRSAHLDLDKNPDILETSGSWSGIGRVVRRGISAVSGSSILEMALSFVFLWGWLGAWDGTLEKPGVATLIRLTALVPALVMCALGFYFGIGGIWRIRS